ncbi:MAG TPA: DUF3237 domain-containing protein [Nevskiaceae bacterium]|nr:DUF3237 domain-containing protein [Nevskiaceae bacterium]
MKLEKVLIYRLTKMRGPLADTTGSPHGDHQYWEMTAGTLTDGAGLHAHLALPGGDWMRVSSDGYWRPNVRVQFVTDDNVTILMHYTGVVEQTATFKTAATNSKATSWGDQYMRMHVHFETGSGAYDWLNKSIFIARGRLLPGNQIEYEIYRVT